MPRRHADAACGLQYRRIDVEQARHAVSHDGQHRIQSEREQRRQKSECGKAMPEYFQRQRRKREQQRVEQRQQRKARHGLHDTHESENGPTDARAPARQQDQGGAHRKTQQQGSGTQQNVLPEIIGKQLQRRLKAIIHANYFR